MAALSVAVTVMEPDVAVTMLWFDAFAPLMTEAFVAAAIIFVASNPDMLTTGSAAFISKMTGSPALVATESPASAVTVAEPSAVTMTEPDAVTVEFSMSACVSAGSFTPRRLLVPSNASTVKVAILTCFQPITLNAANSENASAPATRLDVSNASIEESFLAETRTSPPVAVTLEPLI